MHAQVQVHQSGFGKLRDLYFNIEKAGLNALAWPADQDKLGLSADQFGPGSLSAAAQHARDYIDDAETGNWAAIGKRAALDAASLAVARIPLARIGTAARSAVRDLGKPRARVRDNPAFPRGREYIERSHWLIPRRSKLPAWLKNSRWNIKPMWGSDHALADPFRYRFMPRWWKAQNPLPNPMARFWNRTPRWAQLTGGGGAAGGGLYGGSELVGR